MKQFQPLIQLIDSAIKEYVNKVETPALLHDIMEYALFPGGKRIRPLLNLLVAKMFDVALEETLAYAAAIEMIHAYSLIHDDLPALDNDSMRRGKPSTHVAFGEANAILAGDALLNYAFEVMMNHALSFQDNTLNHFKAIRIIANGAGVQGMIAGQFLDVNKTDLNLKQDEELLWYIHNHKTSDLILASIQSSAQLSSPTPEQFQAIEVYGKNIGLVFQIVDDLLDLKDSSSTEEDKLTFPSIYGEEQSKKVAYEKTEEAKEVLNKVFSKKSEDLIYIADFLLNREA